MMANIFAAGEDNFGLQRVTEKSPFLSWMKRRSSSKRFPVNEGEFRPIHLSKRIFVAQPLKSLIVNHDKNTVKVLQGWINDPNGVLPESLAQAKIDELLPVAKRNKYVPHMWIKEVFYEIRPLKHIPGDEGHFIYIIRFYTNSQKTPERRNMKSTLKYTDSTESFRTPLNNRPSPKALADVPPSTDLFKRAVNAPPSVGFTSVKMCSVNAPSRCSKAHCLASKCGPDGSKSPANLQAHFDMLIKNIFNGAVLAEPRIASTFSKDLNYPMKTLNSNSSFGTKRHMLLSKSFELGDGQVDSVVEMLESLVRKTSLTKTDSEESGNCVLTEELVGESGRSFRKETHSSGCDILELKTCTPSTNLIPESALQTSLIFAQYQKIVLASKSSSNNVRCSEKLNQCTDSRKSSSVATRHPDFSVVTNEPHRDIIQTNLPSMEMKGPTCQPIPDTVTDRQLRDNAVSVDEQCRYDQSQDFIPNHQSPTDKELLKADLSKAAPTQISVPVSFPTNQMVFVNNQPKCSPQNSNGALCTPPPVILSRKTIPGENRRLSSDSSTSHNAINSDPIESTKQRKTRMFSCCTGKR